MQKTNGDQYSFLIQKCSNEYKPREIIFQNSMITVIEKWYFLHRDFTIHPCCDISYGGDNPFNE